LVHATFRFFFLGTELAKVCAPVDVRAQNLPVVPSVEKNFSSAPRRRATAPETQCGRKNFSRQFLSTTTDDDGGARARKKVSTCGCRTLPNAIETAERRKRGG
jgi:hypothetical protein